jgi:tight adherence protein B
MSSTGALTDQVSALARLVRSGTSLRSGVLEVAHRHPSSLFHRIASELTGDVTLDEAVSAVSATDPAHGADDDSSLVLLVLGLASRLGGDTAAQLDSLVETLGAREQARRERRAHAATALASTRLLTILPVASLAVIALGDRQSIARALSSTPGLGCVCCGLVLNLAGRLWTRRIITHA